LFVFLYDILKMVAVAAETYAQIVLYRK